MKNIYFVKEDFKKFCKQIVSENGPTSSFLISNLIHNQMPLCGNLRDKNWDPYAADLYWVQIDLEPNATNSDLLNLKCYLEDDEVLWFDRNDSSSWKVTKHQFTEKQQAKEKRKIKIQRWLTEPFIEIGALDQIIKRGLDDLYSFRIKKPSREINKESDPIFYTIKITDIYLKTHQQLNAAIDPNNLKTKFWRAYNFLAYWKLNKKTYCEEYEIKEAIQDLDFIINYTGNLETNYIPYIMASELRAQIAYNNTSYSPYAPQDFLTAVKCIRRANALNDKFSTFWQQYEENETLILKISSESKEKGKFDPRISYHVLMCINQRDYFPNWRKYLDKLFPFYESHIDRIDEFVDCVIQDDMAKDYQKNYVLTGLHNYIFDICLSKDVMTQNIIYKKLLETADKIFAAAIHVTSKIQAQVLHDLAMSIYERIPYTSTPGIDAQMRLADRHYAYVLDEHNYDQLDQEKDKEKIAKARFEALMTVEPYHLNVLTTIATLVSNKANIDPGVQAQHIRYQEIIENRREYVRVAENQIESVKKQAIKKPNIIRQFFAKIRSLFSYSKKTSPNSAEKNPISELPATKEIKTESSAITSNIVLQKCESDDVTFQQTEIQKPSKRSRNCFSFSFSQLKCVFFGASTRKVETANTNPEVQTQTLSR